MPALAKALEKANEVASTAPEDSAPEAPAVAIVISPAPKA